MAENENIIPQDVVEQGETAILDFKLANGEEWKVKDEAEKKPEREELQEEKHEEKHEESLHEEQHEEHKEEEKKEVEEKTQEQKEETKYDFTTLGEDITSEEDVKTKLSEAAEWKKKYNELKEQSETNPYQDDETRAKLYELSKTDKDKAKQIEKLVYGNADPLALLVNDYKQKHPNNKDEELITEIVKDRYPDLFSGDYDNEDIEYKKAKLRLQDDADSVKSDTISQLDNIKISKTKTVTKEEIKNIKDDWTPKVAEALSLNDIEYPFTAKGEKEAFYKHTIDKSELKKLAPFVVENILSRGAELTKDEFRKSANSVISTYIQEKMPDIMSAYKEKVTKDVREELSKKYNVTDSKKKKDINGQAEEHTLDEQDKAISQPRKVSNEFF